MKELLLYNQNGDLLEELEVRLFSDLHLEFENTFRIPNLKTNQIVILAGDISTQGRNKELNTKLESFLLDTLESDVIVIMVAGNHDYWGTYLEKFHSLMRDFESKNKNFYYFNDDSLFINGVEFLGSTLWTDFNKEDALTFLEIEGHKTYGKTANTSKDYHKIKEKKLLNGKHNYSKLTSKKISSVHRKSINYIKSRMNEDHVRVVTTHFTPSELFLDTERWNNEIENGYDYHVSKYAYYSELESLAEHFDYWFAGHTHKYVDIIKNGVHYLSNPRGYIDKKNKKNEEAVSKFNPDFLIKIKTKK